MIDIENIVFTAVSNAVKAEYPNAAVYGEYVEAPADFPCVCISEDDNYSYGLTQDNALEDNNVGVMYSVNIFTSNQVGKKTEAKKIAKIVDSVLLGFKMSRTALLPVPNADTTIYRITGRYTAVIGRYGDGNYQMYR